MKLRVFLAVFGLFFSALVSQTNAAEGFPNALQAVNYSILPGDRTQLDLVMSDTVKQTPRSFALDNPPRIVLDFPKTSSSIGKQRQLVGLGAVNDVLVLEASGRTRAIISLNYASSYDLSVKDKHIYLILKPRSATDQVVSHPVATPHSNRNKGSRPARPAVQTASAAKKGATNRSDAAKRILSDFDFHKGEGKGDGRVVLTLSDPHTPTDVHKEGERLIVDLLGTTVPPRLDRRFDVTDFSTKVQSVDIFQEGKNARIVIATNGPYKHSVFQAGDQLSIDIKSLAGKSASKYKGKTISLNIQDISVRTVLQIISDEMERNVIISDNVKGSVALRLDNVPVDQALDVILKTQGLSVQVIGDVMFIGPSRDIVAREKQALKAALDLSELSPLKTDLLQINYAKANDILKIIQSKEASLLSERGAVTVDKRTNTLLVRDTEKRIEALKALISKLDIPVRQVLIESRIVIANQSFAKELGVKWGVTGIGEPNGNNNPLVTTGTSSGADQLATTISNNQQLNGGNPSINGLPAISTGTSGTPTVNNRLNVNLPATAPAGQIAFALLTSDVLLDLELSAMQTEGNGEVVSTPRVITIDQEEAEIRQGVEVGFQEASSSGATSVSFKEAVLKLKVTPQITPDESLILDLTVSKDSVG
ncbi:MAG: type IV pilus secretin family protein, partial [Gammaproteobacteria bacterium]